MIAVLAFLLAAEVVSFPSGNLTLRGVLYRPPGSGPFPAVLYNHGSAMDNSAASEALGPIFAEQGMGLLHAPPSRTGAQRVLRNLHS